MFEKILLLNLKWAVLQLCSCNYENGWIVMLRKLVAMRRKFVAIRKMEIMNNGVHFPFHPEIRENNN